MGLRTEGEKPTLVSATGNNKQIQVLYKIAELQFA